MTTYTTYDPSTGALVGRCSQPANQPAPSNSVEGAFDFDTHIWDGSAIIEVPAWEPVVETNKISNLPPQTEARWSGSSTDTAIVEDGELEFDLLPGQRLMVTLLPAGHASRYVEVRG